MAIQDTSIASPDDASPGGPSPSEPPRPGRWRFANVVLDEQVAGLRVDGRPVELDRSSYDVLLALLQHAGEVMGKDELLEAGWPGRVVSENSLSKAVSRLRHALGEHGAALRAVHGYGYRLAANVSFEAVPIEQVQAHPHDALRLREGDPLPYRPGWRLERRLGAGAVGVIYLAVSEAGQSRAIKLATGEAGLRSLKREIALARYIDSMQVEGRQPDRAASRLSSVAPVLGWNLTQAPFFLELPYYPEGDLRDWATIRGGLDAIDITARLSLCAQLCDAVAGLHEIGVIHKDLKPQNLYPVAGEDDDGEPWRIVLSDLGAGEATLAPQLAQLGITLSLVAPTAGEHSSQGGSLLYLAPEVIAGELPTQRSDVFALGVLLFQILAGDLRRTLAPGWEHQIDDELLREDIATAAALDPKDRLLDARTLGQRLRDLPARRAALADERQQAAQVARQAEKLLQLTRWRRQLLVGGGVLALFLGLSLWQQHRTEQARAAAVQSADRAEAEAAKTRGVVQFLTRDVLQQADPYSTAARTITLRQAIDRAASKVATRFPDNPGVAGAIHGTLAASYQGMNEFTDAVAQYRLQLAALRKQPSPNQAVLARTQADLCAALLWQGDLKAATRACEQARDNYLASGLEPDRAEVFLALIDSRNSRYVEVLQRLQPRLKRIARSGDDELYGYALTFLGAAHNRLGQVADTERVFAKMVELHRGESDQDSMALAWGLADHGNILLQLGREREGKAQLDEAMRMFERVAGPDHPQAIAPHVYLARHALASGNPTTARALAAPAYQASLKAAGWQHWTIYAAFVLMQSEAQLGHPQAAHELQTQLEDMARANGMEVNFPYLRNPQWSALARMHLALGEIEPARHYVDKLRVLSRETTPANPLLLGKVACMDSELARLRGEMGIARRAAEKCRTHIASAVPDASPLASEPRRLLARLDAQAGARPATQRAGSGQVR